MEINDLMTDSRAKKAAAPKNKRVFTIFVRTKKGNVAKSIPLTAKQKMLLDRQKGLVRDLQTKGSPLSPQGPIESGVSLSREDVLRVAKRAGILTSKGKLSPAYK